MEFQNVSVHQLKDFPHMGLPIENLAVLQQLGNILAYLFVSIE